jgi:hypothetical protein
MSQIRSFNLLLALSNMGGLTHNTRFVCILIFGGDFALPWPMNLVIAFNSLPDFFTLLLGSSLNCILFICLIKFSYFLFASFSRLMLPVISCLFAYDILPRAGLGRNICCYSTCNLYFFSFFYVLFFFFFWALANHAARSRLILCSLDHRISFGTWIFLGRFSTVHMVNDSFS